MQATGAFTENKQTKTHYVSVTRSSKIGYFQKIRVGISQVQTDTQKALTFNTAVFF